MADILPLLIQMTVIFSIFYFLIIRPQNKKKNDFLNQLNKIKKGDKVITSGGLKGTIKDFQGKSNDIIVIDVGHDTKVNCLKEYLVKIESI